MTSPLSPDPAPHRHMPCYACRGTEGYYPTDPQHDDCADVCNGSPSWQKTPEGACQGQCPCECRQPLTPQEVMEVRDLLDRLR